MNYIIRNHKLRKEEVSCGTEAIPYHLHKLVNRRGVFKYPKDNTHYIDLMLKTIERTIWTF